MGKYAGLKSEKKEKKVQQRDSWSQDKTKPSPKSGLACLEQRTPDIIWGALFYWDLKLSPNFPTYDLKMV